MGQIQTIKDLDGKNTLAKALESKALDDIDAIVVQFNPMSMAELGPFKRAVAIATTVNMLRERLDDAVMKTLMPLQNTTLGFLTDKKPKNGDPGGYPHHIVRDVAIEATLRGAYMTNNEVNIIAEKCYLTKNFFVRALREFLGLTDLTEHYSVPRVCPSGQEVDCKATWRLNGKFDSLERTFPVRVNDGMGADAVLGKARRKLLAAVYSRVSGTEQGDGEVEEHSPRATESLNAKLGELAQQPQSADAPGREVSMPQAPPVKANPDPTPKRRGSQHSAAELLSGTAGTGDDIPLEEPKGGGK